MNRVTEKQLQDICDEINRVCGTPMNPYTQEGPQAKCYHLSFAYGGVALHQMCDEGSSIRDVFPGHMPKRELEGKMRAFLRGIAAGAVKA